MSKLQLFIFLTNICNLRCKGCPVFKDIHRSLTLKDIEKIATTWDYSRVALLGGEPYAYKDLNKVVDMFNKPVTIYTNGTMLREDNIIENVVYAVSLDSLNQKINDTIRGQGVHKKVMRALNTLRKNKEKKNIKEIIIRTTYNSRNYSDIFNLIEFAEKNEFGLALHPRIGWEVQDEGIYAGLTAEQQLNLFREIIKHDKMVILTPHFFQWIGNKHYRCPAGEFRLAIRENGMVKPCQWGSYIIGSIRNHDFEYFRKKGIEYNKEFVQKRIPKSCLFCERVMQCHGGCLLINDTVRCPLRYNGGSYNIRRFYGNSAISRFKVGLKRLGRIGFSGC